MLINCLFLKRIVGVSLFALCVFPLQAQYYFHHLTEKDGLSDNRVTCFLKDRTGFLWIGTKNGLNRYDGQRFRVFKPGTPNSISSGEINALAEDKEGNIWVATNNGLNCYHPLTDHWQVMKPVSSDFKNDVPSYIIWDLFADENNGLWIVSDVWELSRYDLTNRKFHYYDWPTAKQSVPGGNYRSIQKIKKRNQQEFWLATTVGLFSLQTSTGRFQFLGGGFYGSIIDLQYDAPNKKVFLVTDAGQIFCYDEVSGKYQQILPQLQAYPAKQWLQSRSHNDGLLMAHPSGMLELNRQTGAATIILHQPNLSSSLPAGGSRAVYLANDGIVWAGTSNGIAYYNRHNRQVDFIPLTPFNDKEAMDNMSAVLFDEKEKCYFITSISAKTVFIINKETGAITSVSSVAGQPLSACTNICQDRQGEIWLLTEAHLYRYDRQRKSFRLFPTPNGNEAVIFHDFIEDREGNYWLATWRDGVYRYGAKTKTWYQFTNKDSISARNITALLNDPIEPTVWIGTYNTGIYKYDLRQKSFVNFSEHPANPEYLQLNLATDLEAVNGRFWLTTNGAGLYQYRQGQPYEKSLTHFTTKNGLQHDSYSAVASDEQNRLWLLHARGLDVLTDAGRPHTNICLHPAMSFASYLPDHSYPKRIFYHEKEKDLLVPVGGGLLVYHTDAVIPPMLFPLVFTDIREGNRSLLQEASKLSQLTHRFSYRSHDFYFQAAALHYGSGNGMQYEYKLHNQDTQWTAIGASGMLHFPDLPAGDYQLQVRARDGNGNVSRNTVAFSFYIAAPFWLSWWFIAALSLLLVYGMYRWIVLLRQKLRVQKILNYFATSLYGRNTIEDIFWDIARNCISRLNFVDCVVYLYDPVRRLLVQKAAYGPKIAQDNSISNQIEIPLGAGIVGAVAQSGKPERIGNTSKDSRYLVDDERRYSELAVPILVDGKIFGVIDSEHPRKRFFKRYHLRLLQGIASICAQKISRYVVEERLRTKISRDLHDEIGSTLSSISVLSKVALSKADSGDEVSTYLAKIKASSFVALENMSDIVWAINPKNDKLEALVSHMKEFAADICEAKGIALHFQLPDKLEHLPVDLSQRKNLFLIFKEAVNNAIKYSGCRHLHIVFSEADEQLQMMVQDDGKGFSTALVSKGNGLLNMQERAAECNGRLSIESNKQAGTCILLQLPIPHLGGIISSSDGLT